MKKTKNENVLVWIDMEMTGLDPEKEKILEIATLVTDSELEVVARGPELVIHQSDKVLKAMDAWNQNQHKKSGLIEAVRCSKLTVNAAETQTLNFLKKYCRPGCAPLCGNSIHHDRRFLAKFMPRIHQFLHYRLVDVSSVKELVKRWYPKTKDKIKKSNEHRALADILESVEELRHYRRLYFKKSPPKRPV